MSPRCRLSTPRTTLASVRRPPIMAQTFGGAPPAGLSNVQLEAIALATQAHQRYIASRQLPGGVVHHSQKLSSLRIRWKMGQEARCPWITVRVKRMVKARYGLAASKPFINHPFHIITPFQLIEQELD